MLFENQNKKIHSQISVATSTNQLWKIKSHFIYNKNYSIALRYNHIKKLIFIFFYKKK